MASILNNLFGGARSSASSAPAPAADVDFGDFAKGADPVPLPIPAEPAAGPVAGGAESSPILALPYTKWYRIDERHSLSEFRTEACIVAIVAIILVVHSIGSRLNRARARKWIRAHAAPLSAEFALVGFAGAPPPASSDGPTAVDADTLLREKSLFEFSTYATGRANVAFVDVNLTLAKRFNPAMLVVEAAIGFLWDTHGSPADLMEAVLYPFDGREALTVPGPPGAAELRAAKDANAKSSFDGFVWALVNKSTMRQMRDDRYDASITSTKDHPKLPNWLTVMSESAEITDLMLTDDLIGAAAAAGQDFDYLIVSDQPVDKPKTVEDTGPLKRVSLKYRLPSHDDYTSLLPIFRYFLRVPDQLAESAHFRPAVLRKLKAVREEAVKQIQKVDQDEKAEERALDREKKRKAKRDQELAGLDAKASRKYLEKERERELRKASKRVKA